MEKDNKKQFYFSQRGRAVSGLKTINGKQYYFSKRGEMLKGWRWIGGQNIFQPYNRADDERLHH